MYADLSLEHKVLKDIVEKAKVEGITQTALIYVGRVLDPKAYDLSKLYDPSFTTGFRKGSE